MLILDSSEITTQLQNMFTGQEETDGANRSRDGMSVTEKMLLWQRQPNDDCQPNTPAALDLFEGVKDEVEDEPVNNTELPLYSALILDSQA